MVMIAVIVAEVVMTSVVVVVCPVVMKSVTVTERVEVTVGVVTMQEQPSEMSELANESRSGKVRPLFRKYIGAYWMECRCHGL